MSSCVFLDSPSVEHVRAREDDLRKSSFTYPIEAFYQVFLISREVYHSLKSPVCSRVLQTELTPPLFNYAQNHWVQRDEKSGAGHPQLCAIDRLKLSNIERIRLAPRINKLASTV